MLRIFFISIVSLLALVAISPSMANSIQSKSQFLQAESQCRIISKGAAMSTVARRIEGKVLSASLNRRAQPPVYRVKTISKSGRVRVYRVNACSGRLIG